MATDRGGRRTVPRGAGRRAGDTATDLSYTIDRRRGERRKARRGVNLRHDDDESRLLPKRFRRV